MKTILSCLLVLAISVTLSNGYCFRESLRPGISGGVIVGCLDSNGKVHEFSSKWRTEDCHDCSCYRDGIQCCSSFATPVGYDEKKCVKIFDKETCTYKVVEKHDSSKECPVHGWVG